MATGSLAGSRQLGSLHLARTCANRTLFCVIAVANRGEIRKFYSQLTHETDQANSIKLSEYDNPP